MVEEVGMVVVDRVTVAICGGSGPCHGGSMWW